MRSHKSVVDKHMPRDAKSLAQQLNNNGGKEIATPLRGGAIPELTVTAEQLAAQDGKRVADARVGNPEEGEAPPDVKRAVVLEDKSVISHGASTRFPRGKVIDSLNYDLSFLSKQGVRMKVLAPGQDPFEVLTG